MSELARRRWENELRRLMALAARSRKVELIDVGPRTVTVALKGPYLRKRGEQIVEEKEVPAVAAFHVGPRYPRDSLAVVWMHPPDVFHPNILPPAVCVGEFRPDTFLVDVVVRLYEMLRGANFATHNALNPEAAEYYCFQPQDRFPLTAEAFFAAPVKVRLLD